MTRYLTRACRSLALGTQPPAPSACSWGTLRLLEDPLDEPVRSRPPHITETACSEIEDTVDAMGRLERRRNGTCQTSVPTKVLDGI
jgi:hypothetical protein